jgi:hypothetical protein
VAQLGARFHGMEEVIGSIPIRSTNYFNNLDDWAILKKGPKRSNKSLLSFGPRFEQPCDLRLRLPLGRSDLCFAKIPFGSKNGLFP